MFSHARLAHCIFGLLGSIPVWANGVRERAPMPKGYEHIVPGRRTEVEALRRRIVEPLTSGKEIPRSASRGFLLHGPSNNGKQTLADALARELHEAEVGQDGTKVQVKHFGVTKGAIDEMREFIDSLNKDPGLAVIHNANLLFKGGHGSEEAFGAHLMEIMRDATRPEREGGKRVMFLGMADKNIGRPDIDTLLRGRGYLETWMEFRRPSAPERHEALPLIAQSEQVPIEERMNLEPIVQRTHGYTLGELAKVLVEAHDRVSSEGRDVVTERDVLAALQRVPSEVQQRYQLSLPKELKLKDVIGAEKAKQYIERVRLYIDHPEAFERLGAYAMDNGIFLYGPPGNGKTELARAVASEFNLPFIALSAANVRNKYVGESARVLREAYEILAEAGGGILFLDEVDSLAPSRDGGGLANDPGARETTTTLLDLLDGIRRSDKVVVMVASNRPEVVDEAFMRQGRASRIVKVDELRGKEIRELLGVKTRGMKLAGDVNLDEIAQTMSDFGGAGATAVPQRAVEFAILREGHNRVKEVTRGDFERAIEEVRDELSFTRSMKK